MAGSRWPDDVRAHAAQLFAAGASLADVVRDTGVPKSTAKGWRDSVPTPPGTAAMQATARTEAATAASVASRHAVSEQRRQKIDDTLQDSVAQLTGLLVGAADIESDLIVVQRRINAAVKQGQPPAAADLAMRQAMLGGVDVADWTRMRSAAARDLLAVRKALITSAADDADAGDDTAPVLIFATASQREVSQRPTRVFTLTAEGRLVDYDGPEPDGLP